MNLCNFNPRKIPFLVSFWCKTPTQPLPTGKDNYQKTQNPKTNLLSYISDLWHLVRGRTQWTTVQNRDNSWKLEKIQTFCGVILWFLSDRQNNDMKALFFQDMEECHQIEANDPTCDESGSSFDPVECFTKVNTCAFAAVTSLLSCSMPWSIFLNKFDIQSQNLNKCISSRSLFDHELMSRSQVVTKSLFTEIQAVKFVK